nr:methyl-accepting chemotaxis protein [uncultured Methanospirillum sp.]
MKQSAQLPDHSHYEISDVDLFDALDLPVLTVDRSLAIKTINIPAAILAGIPPEFCIGKDYREIFGIEDGGEGKDPAESAISMAIPSAGEGIARFKSGPVPIKYGSKPIFNNNGEVLGSVNYILDQRHKAVVKEITQVLNNIQDGHLDARTDSSRYQGDAKNILEAVNNIIESMSKPLMDASIRLKHLNDGIVPEYMDTKGLGFFRDFAETVNTTIIGKSEDLSQEKSLNQSSGITVSHFDALSIPVMIVDEWSQILYANPIACAAVRKSHEDLLNESITLAFTKSEALVVGDAIKSVLAGEKADAQISVHLPREESSMLCLIDPVKNSSRTSIGAVLTFISGTSGDTSVIEDLERVMREVEEGSLKATIAEEKYSGDSRVIVDTINHLIRSLSDPLTLFATTISQTSAGKIPDRISRQYSGELAEIATDLNNTIDAIDLLVSDGLLLTKAIEEGKLGIRTDATRHQGQFRDVIEGFNKTLDTVIEPLNMTAEYMDRISKGDIPAKITDEYRGDFNEIKNNLNVCIDAINLLVSDGLLLKAAVQEGKLGTRTDASKHFGQFREVIDGINNILDAVVEPLNMTAEYMDRISKGDIPAKITDEYRGDFNEIKNNLNVCIDAINLLVSDGLFLTTAIEEGKLDTRSDVSKHFGEFKAVIQGFNNTLDAVVEPLNMTAEYMDRISKGDIPAKITDEYRGDFNEIKNNLNVCIDAINLLVSDGLLLKAAVQEGKLGTRTDASKHFGQFREVIDGINNILDAVVEPLNMTAEYMDRISKGDIPAKITDEYRGDFNEIKNNLNVCIDAINLLVSDGLSLTTAIEEGKLDTRSDVSKHFGEFKAVIQGFNNTLDAVVEPLNMTAEYMDRISKGDIPAKITDEYRGDFNEIKNNLNVCIDAINLLVSDGLSLTTAIEEGKLDTRSDVSKHFGEFKAVIQGFNNTLDAVVEPLNMTAEYMDRISKGDIPAKITDEYRGDFNEIKNNLNVCIDAINLLVSDGLSLTTAIEEGKLDTRSDVSKHFGEFKAVIQGFNNTLDAVVEPLNMTAEYMDRISKGDIPAKITDEYHGDFNEIKNNLNVCIDAINLLVSDGLSLTTAIEEGKLDTRSDVSKHFGEFNAVIQGFNNTLDAVVEPLNMTAEYMDRISKGDIPAKITDEYRGDFNEIKNNLNVCIDAINLLVSDGLSLTTAIEEGKLDTRSDVSKHFGEFKAVIQGFNNTLDAVVEPLNMTAEYMDRISKGDIPAKITDEYRGDFNEIKNNLNVCIDAINLLVSDGLLLTTAIEEGKLDTRSDVSKHFGEFKAVIQGFNNTLDAVVEPLNMTAEYMDRISKGDIPAKITDEYRGDFNEIKNNLNVCIDAVNLLISDTKMLTEAAVEGILDTRADEAKHRGDFRTIVSGVNDTLDSVVTPIRDALRVSKDYANYNFTTRIDSSLKMAGEWIEFKNALDNIGIQISDAIGLVNNQLLELASNAEEAASSIEEVSSGAQQIAQNTGKVSGNAERGNDGIIQVLKAMEDLNLTVGEVSQRAEQVSSFATQANEFSRIGIDLAKKSEISMEEITRSSVEVDKIVNDIDHQMEEIGKIVRLISDIANQTNLLALNAAIEAARAGEAGRGFAVVAAEVKSLAQDSRQSAENIADMISNLQDKAKQATVAMKKSGETVEEGSQSLTKTLEAFTKIADSIEDITRNTVDVASASEEQAASVQEVTASINEVSNLVINTANEAGDAAAATEEASASIEQISRIFLNVNEIVDSVSHEIRKFVV